jgi:uncharacterized repeat protein (TIGR01451 family)
MRRLSYAILLLFAFQSQLSWATGEPATYFNIFVPPNATTLKRDVCLIVTALHDSTTFEIIDDGMDGDTDDSKTGMLMAGQSYILYLRDNGINDDAPYPGESPSKQDGDYFIIKSNNLVYASQSTNSDWQHDWVPAVNKSSLGQKFIIYAPQISTSKRDVNVFAYEDTTLVTIRKISTVAKTTSGFTTVDFESTNIVARQVINRGEDIIYKYNIGRDALNTGETYVIESSKPVTCQYGALFVNERDGGGYVPSSNGSASGNLFYFAVPYQAVGEQEIRVVSWNQSNPVTLSRYSNGTWIQMKTMTLDSLKAGDWVGKSNGNVSYPTVFKVECAAGKQVSVFEANWLETGSPGTSDIATMLSGPSGTTAGTRFLAYMAPPGTQTSVNDPFTGKKFSQASHAYIFANRDTVHVTVKDAYTNGTKINRTYTILPNRYVDCFLDLAQWKSIYNGTGTTSGPERPYLLITSDKAISVMNTNFNDNWMMYFGTSSVQNLTINSSSSKSNAIPGDTITVTSNVVFKNNVTITDVDIKVLVENGLLPLSSSFNNTSDNTSIQGTINTQDQQSTVSFANVPDLVSTNQYTITTEMVVQTNYNSGAPITQNIVSGTETIITGKIDGFTEQTNSAESFQNNTLNTSNMLFTRATIGNIVTDLSDSWTSSWVDINNDGWEDLFVTQYSKGAANLLYKNNGNKTFTKISGGDLGNYKQGAVTSAWADVDNDGDLDAVLTNNYGFQNSLYINNNGSFTRNTTSTEFLKEPGYFHGATFADYDRDGKLDVFLCNYMPTKFHVLFKGNGDGTFTKIKEGEIATEAHFSVGATWADYDNDGWPDLFIPNGRGDKNSLFHNKGNGTFAKITEGAIVNDIGNSVASAWGDYDNDGDLDLFVANASKLGNWLYRNEGNGSFTKITTSGITNDFGDSHGCSWVDVDNDGDLDLYVTNDKKGRKWLYLNQGNGQFSKLTNDPILAATGNSFGNSWADYDHDGDIDVFLATHSNEVNFLYDNNGNANKWISIKLHGTNSNKTAIGARVRVKANGVWQMREINSQEGIGGQSTMFARFGLGNASQIDSIQIKWPSGYVQNLTNRPVNQFMNVTEENSVRVSGIVFYDKNSNCVQDAGENGISGVQLTLSGSEQIAYSNRAGGYAFNLGTGNYTVNVNSSKWTKSCSAPIQVQVAALGTAINNVFIPLKAISDFTDTKVEMGATAMRKGFQNKITINVSNSGTQDSQNDTLTLVFDQAVVPLSSSLPWNSKNGNTCKWLFSEMPIGFAETIEITDSVSINTTVGDWTNLTATISHQNADNNLSNNTYSLSEKIVGAIDPNYLAVAPEGEGTGGFISHDQLLKYTVHFENMGNYPATNVFIEGEFPEGLDASKLSIEISSHNYEVQIVNGKTLRFNFRNIELADSSKPLENKGFISYVLPTKNEVVEGQMIHNQARIIFDYEAALHTNLTLNTVKQSTGSNQLVIAPNPCSSSVKIRINYSDPGFYDRLISSYSIENMEGKVVRNEKTSGITELTLGCDNLNTGSYIIFATDSDGKRLEGRLIVK